MTGPRIVSLVTKKASDLSLHSINNQISPLAKVSYEAQLKQKQRFVKTVLRKIASQLRKFGNQFDEEVESGLPCRLSPIVASPECEAYRNKDEFSIWPGKDGHSKVVGFLSGSLRDPNTYCVPADEVFLSKESHKIAAQSFQNYISNVSPHGICTHFDRPEGNWRRLIVRSNRLNQLMMIAVFHPKELTFAEIVEEKERLTDFFEPKKLDLGLVSLFFQACRKVRCSRLDAPYHLLFGQKHLNETVNGISFSISPDSFFQVNTSGAEALGKIVLEGLNLNKDTILLDLFCGIGSFSLQAANQVAKVYSIEESYQAVEDANLNASNNNIHNCLFVHGKTEEKLLEVINEIGDRKTSVILNPPRGGVSSYIVGVLRQNPQVQEIAYISCNPAGDASDNLIRLCRPFKPGHEILGQNFKLREAIPLDLFPQTNHCELIFLLDRNEGELFF